MRLLRILATLLVGITSIFVFFVRDVVQAASDALAPRDELRLKSLNPDLAVYRHGVLRELIDRVNRVEAISRGLAKVGDSLHSKKRRWPVSIECEGRAGTTQTAVLNPQCLFRATKIIATDDEGGAATSINQIIVGQRLVLPAAGVGIPTTEFAHNKISNDIVFPVCQPGLMIAVTVRFERDCKWRASLFGDALV